MFERKNCLMTVVVNMTNKLVQKL